MRRPRVILVAAVAMALAGTVTAAAASDDPSGAEPSGTGPSATASCPPPGQGAGLDSVKVKDGKVYFNGKEVAKAPADGPLTVAVKDGQVYVGKAAEKIGPPPDAALQSHASGGKPGTVSGEAGGQMFTTDGPIRENGARVFKEGDTPDGPGKPGERRVTCAFSAK
jgi:hypothetical protein